MLNYDIVLINNLPIPVEQETIDSFQQIRQEILI